jgi:hypothetical protein
MKGATGHRYRQRSNASGAFVRVTVRLGRYSDRAARKARGKKLDFSKASWPVARSTTVAGHSDSNTAEQCSWSAVLLPPGVDIKTRCSSATIPNIRVQKMYYRQTDENREPSVD